MSSKEYKPSKIPLLTAENYFTWKDRILTAIKAKSYKAYCATQGTYLLPPVARTAAAQSSPEYLQQLEDWHEADAKATDIIQQGLSDVAMAMLASKSTANAKWKELEARYGQTQFFNRTQLQAQLQMLKQGNSKLDDFLNAIDVLQTRLTSMGHPPEPSLVIHVLIWGLNSQFTNWIPTFQSQVDNFLRAGDNEVTVMERLKIMIRNTDEQINAHSNGAKTVSKEMAMAVNTRPTQSKRPRHKCTFCKRLGHLAEKCFINPSSTAYKEDLALKVKNHKRSTAPHNNEHEVLGAAVKIGTHFDSLMHWLVDTGAGNHLTESKEDFDPDTFEEGMFGTTTVGGKGQLPIMGKGTISLKANLDGNEVPRKLFNVYWVPKMGFRLFSVEQAAESGYFPVYRTDGTATIQHLDTGKRLFNTIKDGRTCFLDCFTVQHHALVTTKPIPKNAMLWHQRLGHIAKQAVTATLMRGDIQYPHHQEGDVCRPCLQGGQVRHSFKPREARAKEALALVHSDVVGPMPPTLQKSTYFVTFVDDATGYTVAYTMKTKDEVYGCFESFLPFAERAAAKPLRIFRPDGGGEYVNGQLQSLLTKLGCWNSARILLCYLSKHQVTRPSKSQSR